MSVDGIVTREMIAHWMTRQPADPLFREIVRDELDARDIVRVAAGTAGALRIANFLPAAMCSRLVDSIATAEMTRYDAVRYDPPSYHLGPVFNEFAGPGVAEEYRRQANKATAFWMDQPAEVNVRAACVQRLANAWPGDVGPVAADGGDLFWGMLREATSGTLIHWDEIARERPDELFETPPLAQLAFNLFLSLPEQGGQALIWHRRPQPVDEKLRKGYGYGMEVARQEVPLVVVPTTGDAVLFDSRNYHAVGAGQIGRRIALSFFVGLTYRGSLRIWS